MVVFDLLSILAVAYLITVIFAVNDAVAASSAEIQLQSPLFIYSIAIFIPTLHTLSLIQLKPKLTKTLNQVIIAAFAAVIGFSFYGDHKLKKFILDHGYIKCDIPDYKGTSSSFHTFSLKGGKCEK